MSIAAVTCLFSFGGFKKPYSNYHRARATWPRDLPLLTVELSCTGRYHINRTPNVLKLYVPPEHAMFQKERLLQIGAEHMIERGFDKIILLDADIVFDLPDWHRKVEGALDDHDAVHCFSSLIQQYSDQRKVIESVVKRGSMHQGHPGGAWAYRAAFLRGPGLWQWGVVGGGDSANYGGMKMDDAGVWTSALRNSFWWTAASEEYRRQLMRWGAKCRGTRITCVDQQAKLLPHGPFEARQYMQRNAILGMFNPARDLLVNHGEPLRWHDDARPELRQAVKDYLLGRREDD